MPRASQTEQRHSCRSWLAWWDSNCVLVCVFVCLFVCLRWGSNDSINRQTSTADRRKDRVSVRLSVHHRDRVCVPVFMACLHMSVCLSACLSGLIAEAYRMSGCRNTKFTFKEPKCRSRLLLNHPRPNNPNFHNCMSQYVLCVCVAVSFQLNNCRLCS